MHILILIRQGEFEDLGKFCEIGGGIFSKLCGLYFVAIFCIFIGFCWAFILFLPLLKVKKLSAIMGPMKALEGLLERICSHS